MQKLRLALWVLIGIGTLAGLYGATQRFSAESKNRVVELTLDIVELQKLAAAEGKPLYEVLKRFKEAGVTSVAVTEDTLGTLEENRQLEVIPNAQLNTSYIVAHQGNFDRIVEAIQHRTHLGNQLSLPPGLDNRRLMDVGLTIPQPFHTIKSIGVGLDPNVISQLHDEAHKLHLSVVGRVSNSVNITEEGIHWTLQRLKEQGVHTVIFSGDDVLGYDSQLKVTASAFRDLGLNYGAVEFSKMKGDAALHRLAAERAVRVHTIPGAELATSTPDDSIQRFSLAARERNIRLLYVRLFLDAASPLESNAQYIEKLAEALRRGGLTLGTAHPYEALATPLWVRALIGLSLGAALLLLANEIGNILALAQSRTASLFFAGALLLVALAVVSPKLAALSAAILFASLGVCQRGLLSPIPWGRAPLPLVLQRLARVIGFTSLGIIAVVGLLSDRLFLVKADAFVGIKAALYIPLLLAALVWAAGLQADSPAALWTRLRLQIQRLALLINEPVRFWQIASGLSVLVILAMLWLRSGNEGAAVVSGFELRFRDILDATLPVRPRFKALLFVSLMLGIYLCSRGERLWGVPLFLLGVIAVTDYLNTFCHLHIPLLVSVLRDFLGTLIGVLLGMLVIQLIEKRHKPQRRAGDTL